MIRGALYPTERAVVSAPRWASSGRPLGRVGVHHLPARIGCRCAEAVCSLKVVHAPRGPLHPPSRFRRRHPGAGVPLCSGVPGRLRPPQAPTRCASRAARRRRSSVGGGLLRPVRGELLQQGGTGGTPWSIPRILLVLLEPELRPAER